VRWAEGPAACRLRAGVISSQWGQGNQPPLGEAQSRCSRICFEGTLFFV